MMLLMCRFVDLLYITLFVKICSGYRPTLIPHVILLYSNVYSLCSMYFSFCGNWSDMVALPGRPRIAYVV